MSPRVLYFHFCVERTARGCVLSHVHHTAFFSAEPTILENYRKRRKKALAVADHDAAVAAAAAAAAVTAAAAAGP